MFYCNNRKSIKARATNSLSCLCLGMLTSPLSLEVNYLHKFLREPWSPQMSRDGSGPWDSNCGTAWQHQHPLGTCRRSQFLTSTQIYRIRNSMCPSFCHLALATPEILGGSKKIRGTSGHNLWNEPNGCKTPTYSMILASSYKHSQASIFSFVNWDIHSCWGLHLLIHTKYLQEFLETFYNTNSISSNLTEALTFFVVC